MAVFVFCGKNLFYLRLEVASLDVFVQIRVLTQPHHHPYPTIESSVESKTNH